MLRRLSFGLQQLRRCLEAIADFTVNEARIADLVDRNPILVTALREAISTETSNEAGAAFARSTYNWTAIADRYRDFFVEVIRRVG